MCALCPFPRILGSLEGKEMFLYCGYWSNILLINQGTIWVGSRQYWTKLTCLTLMLKHMAIT